MSKKLNSLSPEMERAIAIIREHGNIVRYQFGFWARPDAELAYSHDNNPDNAFLYPKDYVGIGTLQALERRGMVRISERIFGRHGLFPGGYEIINNTYI